jgi:hypothetical protein
VRSWTRAGSGARGAEAFAETLFDRWIERRRFRQLVPHCGDQRSNASAEALAFLALGEVCPNLFDSWRRQFAIEEIREIRQHFAAGDSCNEPIKSGH